MKAFKRVLLGTLGLALLSGAAACNNPVGDEHEDHPVGLALVSGTTTVATWTETTGSVGSVAVDAGGSTTLTVVALGDDGDLLAIDGEELTVTVAAAGQGISASIQNVNQVVITGGASAATTTLDLELQHDEHPEVRGSFNVVVQ